MGGRTAGERPLAGTSTLGQRIMRAIRTLFFALVIAVAFYLYTTARPGNLAPSRWIGNSGKVELTQAAEGQGQLDSEESINVNVYKRAVPSVVNIKSRTESFNFFYGVVPEE